MRDELSRVLDYLEDRIDLEEQAVISDRYQKSLGWEEVDRPPLCLTYPLPEDCAFQPFPHREVFDDPEKMLHNQLVCGFNASLVCHPSVGGDLPFSIRADFGTTIIASLFGARIEQVGDDPPWVLPSEDTNAYREVLEIDPLDFSRGWCPRVINTYERFRDILANYPKLNQAVAITLPDLQGPFDNAELLRGSEIFLDLYDQTDLLSDLLDRLARAQIGFARHLQPLIKESKGYSHQHAVKIAGNILIRNDSTIMMSADMYREIVAPHDSHVLREADGGGIHSCGDISHIADAYLDLPGMTGLDLGQPTMNDLDLLYARACARQLPLFRMDVPEEQFRSGEAKKRFPTGVVFRHHAESAETARELYQAYRACSVQ
jgi:hypothetical protein